MCKVHLGRCGLYKGDGGCSRASGDVELVHQSTSNNARDIAVSCSFRQIDEANRSQLLGRTREIGLGDAHGPVRRLARCFVLVINAINLGRADFSIADSIVYCLITLWRRWKGIDAKLGARIDIRAGRERATVDGTRSARIGDGIEVVCVGFDGVGVLALGGVRICDGLRAQTSIEGLLEQIRSSKGENVEAAEGNADLDDSDIRDRSAEKTAAEVGYWDNVSDNAGVLEEEQKLRTVVLGGSDEILVICARDGHGILWQRLGELADWIVSERTCCVTAGGAANRLQS